MSTRHRSLDLVHRDVFLEGFPGEFKKRYSTDAKYLIKAADQAVDLVMDMLGSGPVDMRRFRKRNDLRVIGSNGEEKIQRQVRGIVPWHFDFKSGVGWDPSTFFADIRYGNRPGLDIKVPWELSRCQHFVTLGQAYRLTRNEKYPKAFLEQIQDWIRQNPVKYGVNWVCPMDVALRAGNWLVAFELFRDSPSIPKTFYPLFQESLWEHGHHVYRHLEAGNGFSSNHYLSDLFGLAYLGQVLSQKKWLEFSCRELTREMDRQVYTDGLDYEGSTAYHRLAFELFVYVSILWRRSGMPTRPKLSATFLERLKSMALTTPLLCRSDGTVPLIGDNDSGRAHVFLRRPDSDFRYLINMAALLFDDPKLKVDGWTRTSEVVWLFGFAGDDALNRQSGRWPSNLPPRDPGSSGLAVLRGENDYISFSAQPNGTGGVGNHTHNDKLSFTLWIKGDDFFADPGSGLYTPDLLLRDKLRSTFLHNTIQVDNEEQNHFIDTFRLADECSINVLSWIPGSEIEASHGGYRRLRDPVVHKRKIKRSNNLTGVLEDEIRGKEPHHLTWTFLLGPSIQVQTENDTHLVLTGKNGGLEFSTNLQGLPLEVAEEPYSSAYGVIRPTLCLRWRGVLPLPQIAQFQWAWHRNFSSKTLKNRPKNSARFNYQCF